MAYLTLWKISWSSDVTDPRKEPPYVLFVHFIWFQSLGRPWYRTFDESNPHPQLQEWVFQLQYLLEDSILYHDGLCHTLHRAHGITFLSAVFNIGDGDFALGLTYMAICRLLFEESRILESEESEYWTEGWTTHIWQILPTTMAESNYFLGSIIRLHSLPDPSLRMHRAKDRNNDRPLRVTFAVGPCGRNKIADVYGLIS